MKRAGLVLFVLCVLGSASNGWAMSKGSSVLAIQIGQGTADVVDTDLQGGLWVPAPQPEINAQLEYWHAFADDYAFNISAGAGYFMAKLEPTSANAATDPTLKLTVTSFRVCVGGDRVGQVGDRLTIFMGPGIEFWSGKGKETYEGANASPEETGPTTTRFGLGGRMGGFLKCSDKVSLVGHIGHTWGYASVSKDGGKTTWWPSSFEGAGGVAFNFGSSK